MRTTNADHNRDDLQNLLAHVVHNRIRARAYERYLQRGKIDGHALEDWLNSESEIWGAACQPVSAIQEN